MSRSTLSAACALLLLPVVASGQVRRGPELVVNTYTTGPQTFASVAAADDGSFVVVWQSFSQDGSNEGVFGRRYDAAGVPLGGSEFRINAYTTAFQRFARIASDASGGIAVVWESLGQDGSGQGIYARRFDAAGTPVGGEFRVNTTTAAAQVYPAVASDPAGNFVVAWSSLQGGGYEVFAQRYDATGSAQGSEFRVNTYTTGAQDHPAVAMHALGGFVVVWDSPQDGDGLSVHGQRFDAAGAAQGAEFRVNTYTGSDQQRPLVAAHADGRFVVGWTTFGQYDEYDVMARRYAAGGAPDGGEFKVNILTTGFQGLTGLAADADGNVVVTWEDDAALHDPSVGGVSARRYNVEGTPQNFQFPVNTFTTSIQGQATVATDASGHFVVAWSSTTQDGSASGIIAQRFAKDFIFRDDLEAGSLAAWSSSQTDGGDLSVTADAALNFTTAGLRAVVDDTNGLFVQDDTPVDEDVYRARFYFDPNGFDPGEAQAHRRTRLFIAFEEAPTRRVMAIVLRRLAGAYAVMGRVRQDDDSQVDTGFLAITDAPHWVEVQWVRSSADDALDGTFQMWIDGVEVAALGTLDNSVSAVDFVRMGALSVKTGAGGVLFFDQFESRRLTLVGP